MIINLRKRATIIMFVVLLAFVASIIFVWGMDITGRSASISRRKGSDSTLAVVGKEKIKVVDYQNAIYELINASGLDVNLNQLTKQERAKLYSQAWEEVVKKARWTEILKKEKVVVGDDEASEILKVVPPQWISNDTSFYVNGQFNYERYWQVLSAPNLPQQYRQAFEYHKSLLARNRQEEIVRNDVMNGFRLTVAQVVDAQSKAGTKMVLEALFVYELPPVDSTVTEEQIQTYYKENIKSFERDKWWILRTLMFPVLPSPDDSMNIKLRAEDAEAAIRAGADFEQVAIDFTGDSSIFVERPVSTLDAAEFEELSKLSAGQIGSLYYDRGAWHIPKFIEKSKDTLKYREIFLAIEAGDSTRRNVMEKIEDFRKTARKAKNLDSLIAQYQLVSRQGPYVLEDRDVFVPYFPYNEAVKTYALSSRKGDISEPFPETNGIYYLFATVDITEKVLIPLDSNRDFIKKVVIREKAKEAQKVYAYKLRQSVASGKPFSSFIGVPHVSIDTLKFSSYFEAETRYGPRMAGACYALEPGQMTGPVKCDIGYGYFRCLERSPNDEAELIQQALENEHNDLLDDLSKDLFTKPEIKDFRSALNYFGGE
ncbi:hypothetical protein GX441_01050 [bacterium]|nr:hypothetical protein [bacterium]